MVQTIQIFSEVLFIPKPEFYKSGSLSLITKAPFLQSLKSKADYLIKDRIRLDFIIICHKNIPRDKRFCKTCFTDIEDEYHFILVCPMYLALRSKLIKRYYWCKPSMYKLIQLLSVNNIKELCNLGKFIYKALTLRMV